MHATGRAMLVGAAVVVLAVQCTAVPPSPPAEGVPPSSSVVLSSIVPPESAVAPVTAADLGASWRPGCPVQPEQLRRVSINHLGFDLQTHRGDLIVHHAVVEQVVAIFADLYRLGYPIEKMRTVEHYRGADDELSMRDNNTSAFSCRTIPGSGNWAEHAYGRAIDLNPLLNPYLDGRGRFEPANAAVYLDRNRIDPGLLHDGDPAVRAFTDRGWRWGGHWKSPIDYQHFELP